MSDDEPIRCGICPITFGGWAAPACAWHDEAYIKGSWAQRNLSRYATDQHFLLQLLELAKRGRFQAGKRVQAYAMYHCVRLLGAPYWEGRQY
jgi:hypothetical protein